MTKNEIYTQICKELLEEELLNVADAGSTELLMQDVTNILNKHLEDYILVYKSGVIKEGER